MAMSAFVAFYDYLVAQLTGGEKQHVVTRVRGEGGLRLLLTRQDLNEVRLLKDSSKGGWILKVPHRSGPALKRWWLDYAGAARDETVLEGTRALHAAAKILARMNAFGGTERQIRGAVAFIEDVRSVERAFGAAASVPGYYPSAFGFDRDRTIVRTMRPELRLALEMAAHEQTEREACEGELEELEAAWREAEEIAAIADALLIPESIEDWIQQHRRTSSARRDQGNPPRGLEGDGA